ncbi:MAG: phage protease, partial [Sphingorhabdus sp.]
MNKPSSAKTELFACCSALASEIGVEDGKPVKRVMLMPMGEHVPRNGKPAKIILRDRAHAEAVVAATQSMLGKTDMMYDYDHQAPRAPGVAGKAVAAGWIKPSTLQVADDGIWGEVEFTAQAAEHIVNREYRYSSPYFFHRPTGEVTRIVNMALTNTPNLDMPAIASAIGEADGTTEEEEDVMKFKAIASALGLAEDADEAGIIAAIAPLKEKSEQFDACASAVGVDLAKDGTELASVASAVTALKDAKPGNPDPKKFVSIETVTELQSEMSSMKTRLDAADAKERKQLLDDAQADGRLTPAIRKHCDENFKDIAALASFLADLPK